MPLGHGGARYYDVDVDVDPDDDDDDCCGCLYWKFDCQ